MNLSEEQVREWRAILEADDTASLHNKHQRALADAYLAQQRVIEAAREVLAAWDGKADWMHYADAIDVLRAAVSVGSPETRETEQP